MHRRSLAHVFALMALGLLALAGSCVSAAERGDLMPQPTTVSIERSAIDQDRLELEREKAALEREKFKFQIQLEQEKLSVERLKGWLTGGSILIPLLLGIITLAWQTRTTAQLRERESRDAFDLKAAEIVLASDSTHATKNKSRALSLLFPERFPTTFGDAFEPKKMGGPRFEAKLEVFKAACEKVTTTEEVCGIWLKLFPGDEWVRPLVSVANETGTTRTGGA